LQAIINENKTRKLQEEIIRTNETIYLLERKSSMDIEMSKKEE
ncbi:20317_t:CDS:2, partial [Gigaspora margarita]